MTEHGALDRKVSLLSTRTAERSGNGVLHFYFSRMFFFVKVGSKCRNVAIFIHAKYFQFVYYVYCVNSATRWRYCLVFCCIDVYNVQNKILKNVPNEEFCENNKNVYKR